MRPFLQGSFHSRRAYQKMTASDSAFRLYPYHRIAVLEPTWKVFTLEKALDILLESKRCEVSSITVYTTRLLPPKKKKRVHVCNNVHSKKIPFQYPKIILYTLTTQYWISIYTS